jgi:hypothetical protein
MLPLPFHSYRLRSQKAAQTRLLNCYALASPPEGKGPTMIQGSPGIRSFSTIAKSPQRAAIQFNDHLYCVAGNGFYHVNSHGAASSLGTVGLGRCDIAKNATQIAILVPPHLYVYQNGALTQVTDADFTSRGASKMAVLDNYGGFVEPYSGRFFVCDLANFTVYDALDFATAEGHPDNLVSIESNQRQFVLFGQESIELWDNVGGSGFPFLRVSNGYVENGCAGPDATCAADNTVFWLDTDRLARRLEGLTPRRISTDGCEQAWQDYETVADVNVHSYTHDGHTFIVYSFPSAGATWVYDINTGEWHERESYGQDRWRAAWVVKCYDKTLVGDTQSGNVGEIHGATYSEWGNPLLREATTGAIPGTSKWSYFDRLELDMDVGKGIETGQGSDPEVMLDVSNDGGLTFTAKTNRKLGRAGEFARSVHWDRLGRAKNGHRVFRFRVSDPVPFVVNEGRLQARL